MSFMQSLFFCPAYGQSGLFSTEAGIAQGSGRNRRSRRRMPDNESAFESGQQPLTGFTDLIARNSRDSGPRNGGRTGLQREKPLSFLEIGLDHLFQRVDGLAAYKLFAVDKEGRR